MKSPNISPNTRRSSNSQDAADTTAEMAVQARPLRSTLKALEVRPVLPSVIQTVIEREHYLHSMPDASRRCFGVYLGSELVGAVVFTYSPSRHRADPSKVGAIWLEISSAMR